MKEEPEALQMGKRSIKVPEGCPQPSVFAKTIKHILIVHFGTPELAARCRDVWQSIRPIPEPFASNNEAAYHYRRAMLELNPQAKAWDAFQNAAYEAFLDYDGQGGDQVQPIPGWTLPCDADIELIG